MLDTGAKALRTTRGELVAEVRRFFPSGAPAGDALRAEMDRIAERKPRAGRHIDTGHVDGRAWCGAHRNSLDWRFTDASHALLALRDGTSISPCVACLREMRRIIDEELAGNAQAAGS